MTINSGKYYIFKKLNQRRELNCVMTSVKIIDVFQQHNIEIIQSKEEAEDIKVKKVVRK